jgi:hypothetical protein
MTLKFHSQFTKEYLQELLSPFGSVEVSPEIDNEQQRAIVLFFPNLKPIPSNSELGLLGKIAYGDCSFEVYSDPIDDESDILNCIRKLFSVFSFLRSQAQRENKTLDDDELPSLRILVPSASNALLDGFGCQLELEDWPCGVYFMPKAFRTAIIAINELPITQDTLWFRLLGKGETQSQAIRELLALPENNLPRQSILKLISHWHTALIQHSDDLTEDEQELIFSLSQIFD